MSEEEIDLPQILADHLARWQEKSLTSPAHARLYQRMYEFTVEMVRDFGSEPEAIRDVAEYLAHQYYHHHEVEGLTNEQARQQTTGR